MNFRDAALPHFNALYNFALLLTRNPPDAEDLVQETYLRARKKFNQFGFGTNCKAWMFKIMRNIAIDQIRKNDPLLQEKNELFDDDLFSPAASQDDCINSIDLKTAFHNLPEKYRIPVLLKDVEGFSYQEIADILNFPVGTVMSRLYRGRRKLRSLLSGSGQRTEKTNLKVLRK